MRALTAWCVGFVCAATALVSCAADPDDSGGPLTPHGTPPPGGVAVNATEREYRITTDVHRVPAGPVKFTSANLGTIEHELVIIKTDYPDGQIPLDGQKFDEEAPGVSSPGEISEFEAGKVGEVVVDLAPGHYQLVCNIPLHYGRGMHVAFEVVAR